MNRPEKEVFARLGDAGLNRVLGDLLDQGHLVKLANACGLRYPGMRTQSQKRERILSDLVAKSGREEPARKAVLRVLRKVSGEAARAWERLSADERIGRLRDEEFLQRNGNLGRHLFLLACSPDEAAADDSLAKLLARRDLKPDVADDEAGPAPDLLARESARLKKRVAELHKKLSYLEGQVTKGREIEKSLKRDLIQRKGELAESRMLVERLGREIQEARGAASEAAAATPVSVLQAGASLDELARAVKKAATDQKKLLHLLEKMAETPPQPALLAPEALSPLLKAVEELHRETVGLRRERKKDLQEQGKRIEELHAEVRASRAAAEAATIAPKVPPRRKGEPDRVGVFIDVQNMYYAARQLKGKLDFDALLQTAVRDRRLIQASAYVVETKEIDQSGFIAMLQQRAIEVRRKTLKIRSDGSMKGDWDMEMALDILEAAPRLDVVVLVSGDGDFTSLVSRVKVMGPRVEVIGFPRNTAKSLLEAADRFQPLDRKFMIRIEPASFRAPGDGEPVAETSPLPLSK